jgi:predicted porin
MSPIGVFIAPPGSAAPGVRSSNAINYFTPAINGFQANIMYGFSEQRSNCLGVNTVAAGSATGNGCDAKKGDGAYTGFRLMYNKGPLSASVSTGKTSYASALTAEAKAVMASGYAGMNNTDYFIGNSAFLGDNTTTNMGVSYDLGVARAMFQTGTHTKSAHTATAFKVNATSGALEISDSAVAAAKLKHSGLGVLVPMGATTLKASYNWGSRAVANAADMKADQLSLGANYALSKRTQVYASYSTLTAKNGAIAALATASSASTATVSKKSSGYDIGLSHSF